MVFHPSPATLVQAANLLVNHSLFLRVEVASSIGDKPRQRGKQFSNECFGPQFRLGQLSAGWDGRDHPYQGAIGTVHPNGVGDEINFGNVFIRNTSSVRLVPVDDELTVVLAGDDIFADPMSLTSDVFKHDRAG